MSSGSTSGNTYDEELERLRQIYSLMSRIDALKETALEKAWEENKLLNVQYSGLDKYQDRLKKIQGALSGNTNTEEEEALFEIVSKKIQELELEKQINTYLKDNDKITYKIQRITGYISDNFRNISSLVKDTVSDAKNLADSWIKARDASSTFAKNIGLGKVQMEALAKGTIDNIVNKKIGINYNISAPELLETQMGILNDIGRNIKVYDDAQESIAAMHALMKGGEKEFLTQFENFAVGFEDTEKRIGGMFQKAAKNGLSFSKYSENVKQNIAIAQNYTFKNGLKGLESMALKATAIKMDMQMIASFADKVGSVEGSLETAAKLQVLGGPFANFADPMGMLNESINDIEGLYDRVTRMVGNLGSFDKVTGEVRVSAFNKLRMRAAAEAMGMDYGKLMESINTQAKRREIDRQLKASGVFAGLTEEQRELLRNTATFKEGIAGVTINGNFKKLNELSADNGDFKVLEKETQDIGADVKEIAKMLRGATDILEGQKKQQEAQMAQGWGEVIGKTLIKVTDRIGHSNFLLGALNTILVTQSILRLGESFGKTGRGTGLFKGLFPKRMRDYGSGQLVRGKTITQANVLPTARPKNLAQLKNSKKIAAKAAKAAKNATLVNTVPITGVGPKVFGNGITKLTYADAKTLARFKSITKANPVKVAKAAGTLRAGKVVASLGTKLAPAIGAMASIPVAGWIAAGVTAAAVGTAAAVKAAQKKRNTALTNELERKGITKTGKYSARKLKLIEEGLHTGEITSATRRKLLEQGDYQLLDEIERVAKERGSTGVRSNTRRGLIQGKINEANFTVTNAYFNGEPLKNNNSVTVTGGHAEDGASPILTELRQVRNLLAANSVQNTPANPVYNGQPKIELNLGGSIKLTTDNGITEEIGKKLLTSPMFTKEIIKMVEDVLYKRPTQTNYTHGNGY